jgi:glucokinase
MDESLALGVDIGGTKIAVALINQKGEIFHRKEFPSNIETKETLFQTVLQGIYSVLAASQLNIKELSGIGVGVPGKVDVESGIAVMQNNIPWNNFPLVERLKAELGVDLKIVINNDVKMAAYAEYCQTNMEHGNLFTYITLSTGIAATSILKNEIIDGSGFSGEIGFIPIKADDGYISVENLASGPAIQSYAQKLLNNNQLTTKDVFELYLSGNEEAEKAIKRSSKAMSHAVYSIICILDPKKIILGGNVAFHNPFYLDLLLIELDKFLVDEQKHILKSISISTLGGNNGVIGAGLSIFS